MKPKLAKKLLSSAIAEVAASFRDYCVKPDRNFTRKRKISFKQLLTGIINLEGKSLSNELIDMFNAAHDMPSVSAFVQQRDKILPEAFEAVFKKFTAKVTAKQETLTVLAVDGSDIRIPTNPKDPSTYIFGDENHGIYNRLHLNALYDLNRNIYRSVIIQDGALKNEHQALQQMVDSSDIPTALIIADRGYESYNSMAHIQEKGWYFLIRVRDGYGGIKGGLDLPDEDCYDFYMELDLGRQQTKDMKKLMKGRNYKHIVNSTPFDYLPQHTRKHDPLVFYTLKFRVVRFKITEDTYETVITNLDQKDYPPEKIKELYASRWGIETSFRDLKYTIGLLKYHSKKTVCIRQEIYAKLILYNFVEVITSHVAVSKKPRKYKYNCNFAVATHICRLFLRGKTPPSSVELTITKNLIPVRPNRKRRRSVYGSSLQIFYYRVA